MHQSTTLKDESAWNILWDMTKNALIGGIFGGAIDGLFTNAIFKRAGKTVDKKLRSYDSVTAYQDLGLTFGDETFGAIKAALDIPKNMPTMAGVLPYLLQTQWARFLYDTGHWRFSRACVEGYF